MRAAKGHKVKPKILTTLPEYSGKLFFADIVAGLTVAMVALPLSIAIAIASGAEPEKGLITAIVGGLLISLLGGSRVQIGGPTGAFIVVVFGVIAQHGYDGLVIATLLAGVILVLAGFLRAGNLIAHVPEPVIEGFTIGIAVIIAASQLKDLLGLSLATVPAEFAAKLFALWAVRSSLNLSALVLGIAAIAAIVALRRLAPRLPGLILAVALASAAVAVLALPVETIGSRFGALPSHMPSPSFPDISAARLIELLPTAFVIAFLAGVESLLSALVADRMIGASHRPNAEVLAQGVANIGSALFGGMPATGAIARTATNIRAGAKTPIAGIVHALAILGFMMLAAPLVGYLPMPALAGLLLVTAWNMCEPHTWRTRFAVRNSDRLLILLTFILTLFADLAIAIGVGMAIGLALRFYRRNGAVADWTTPDR